MIYIGNGLYSDSGPYLCHYGRKGMKWGQHIFGEDILPRSSKHKNLEKWGKNENTNLLYITGLSGSGKSTIAQNIGKKQGNTDIIHLDLFFDHGGDYDTNRSKDFVKYLNKHFPDWKKLSLPKDKISMKEWGKLLDPFEKAMSDYSKYQYKKGKMVIAEGVQLLDDTLYPDKSYFKDKPIIVCNTNPIVSSYRAAKRDNNLKSLAKPDMWNQNIYGTKQKNNILKNINN